MSLFSAEALSSAPVRTLLNPGRYSVRIVDAKEVVSKQKQTPGLELTLEVLPGNAIQENNSDPAGRKLFNTIYSSLDPSKRGMFYSRLHALADAVDFDLSAGVGISEEEFTALFIAYLFQKEMVISVKQPQSADDRYEEIGGYFHL